jgi:hypothetical protein
MSDNLDSAASSAHYAMRAAQEQPVWVLLNHVKADHRTDFEHFVHDILKPMAQQRGPEQFRQFRVLHPIRSNDDGTYTYVFLMDPLVVGGDYSFDGLTDFYGAEKAQEYLQLWADALASPQVGYEVVQSSW